MNICLFTSSFLPNVGGMEKVVDILAREYRRQGHEVVVLAKTPRRMKEPPHFDYPVYYYRRSRSEVFFLGSPKRMLAELHRQYHFDVIHAHQMYPTGYLAVRFARQFHVPAVLTSHVGDVREGSKYRRSWIKCRRMVWAMREAQVVTGVGTGICETIDALLGEKKAVYLANGCTPPGDPAVTPALEAKLAKLDLSCGFDLSVCRLHPNKGLEHLVRAYALLKERGVAGPPWVMAGSGQSGESLQNLIKMLHLQDRIFMIGQVTGEERDYLLRRCRMFLQPSLVEGMPLTVLESLAAGVPVLGTDIPGIREILQDKVNGRMAEPGSPEALAQILSEVTEEEVCALRARAPEILATYSWPKIAGAYLKIFERLHFDR